MYIGRKWSVVAGLGMALGAFLVWLLFSADRGNASNGVDRHLRADGISRAELRLQPVGPDSARTRYSLLAAPGVARILQIRHEPNADVIIVQAGVVPGEVRIVAEGGNTHELAARKAGEPAAESQSLVVAELTVEPDWRDSNGNGFPDSLELLSTGDSLAFLDWFRYLAEEQFYRGDEINPEVSDCAALLRYAYREALRRHDGEWATRMDLRTIQPIPDVQKFQYPFTPLRADLFRLRSGPFQQADLSNGSFGQFADAEHLLLYNTRPIGKDIGEARPGDLLFYRQDQQGMPFHAMLFLGASMLDPDDRAEYLLYHTGPDGAWPGEMRRRSITEMMQHPEARWHPVPMNPAFLGVYRWKIVSNGGGS